MYTNMHDEAFIKLLQKQERSKYVLNNPNRFSYDFSKPASEWDIDAALYYLEVVRGEIGIDEEPIVLPLNKLRLQAIKESNIQEKIYDAAMKAFLTDTPNVYKHHVKALGKSFRATCRLVEAIEYKLLLLKVIKKVNKGFKSPIAFEHNTTIEGNSVYVKFPGGIFWFVVSKLIGKSK